MTQSIKKVAVIGAGVMGSGIAAHLANAGILCYLLDIVPPKPGPTDDITSPEFRSRFAKNGIQNALKARPAAFYSTRLAELIIPGNLEDHLDYLKDVDLVIEAVLEDINVKRNLFGKIEQVIKPGAIVSSNTSGLPIQMMIEGRSEAFKKHFLVTHFFNPVRYMTLLEMVSGPDTLPEVTEKIRIFGEDLLGKGIVYGKDTPNFIANRIGNYAGMVGIRKMLEHNFKVEEMDKIFGPAMGRPKSALFRTLDLVGLDTLYHISKNVYEALPNDEDREIFKLPEFMVKMVEQGKLGNKSGQGFYKKDTAKGKKDFLVIDPETLEYRTQAKVRFDCLGLAKEIEDVKERIKTIVYADDAAGKLAWEVMADTLIYTAKRIPEISDDIINIDNAMKWGFMWAIGPFESWDAIGLKESVERMQQEGRKVPQNVLDILAKGYTSFYEVVESKRRYYDFTSQEMRFVPDNPKLIELPLLKNVKANILKKNASASLINIGDGVLCLEFHSKMNSIDEQIIKMMHEAIDEVEQNWEGLVIANQGENFSVGANLFMILGEAMQGNYDRIELGVKQLQYANQRLKYSDKPVVAAPHKMVLGGGCEVCLGADRIVANAETYMGLVEVGAGLIPGGGGTKEMILRQIGRVPSHMEVDLMPYLKAAFEVVGMAKVSFSAEMARELGFLKPSDTITLNLSHLIYDAKQMVLGMVKAGYRAPKPRTDIRMPGEHALAAIQAYLYSMKCGNFISEHDMLIGLKLAKVLTGGKATPRYPVDEDYLLDLEREAFMSLVGEPKTHERMQNLLIKGKPLRN